MPAMPKHNQRFVPRCGIDGTKAFTLVELLVVIAIIAVLAGLSLALAHQVTQGGKKGYTENLIRTLDQAYAAWAADQQAKTPRFYVDDQGTQFPLIDATFIKSAAAGSPPSDPSPPTVQQPEPSLALLILLMSKSDAANSMVKGIDAKLMMRYVPGGKNADGSPMTVTNNPVYSPGLMQAPHASDGTDVAGLQINDAWGRPLRAVFPAYAGGYGNFLDPGSPTATKTRALRQSPLVVKGVVDPTNVLWFRRSYRYWTDSDAATHNAMANSTPYIGDGDEGLCNGNSPYFYSAGFDGDPGTRSDNVYGVKPKFSPDTGSFNNN